MTQLETIAHAEDAVSAAPKLDKNAVTSVPIHPLLRERWSPRAFDVRPIPREQMLSLLEAARWSPSGGNGQPWNFILVERSNAADFQRAVNCLNEGNVVWAQNAPVLLIAVAKTVRDTGAPNRWASYDLGQAVAHLSVQAASEGLVVHQMGGFDAERTREEFAIPAGYEPLTFIAIGERSAHTSLPEALQERELAPRTRNPLETFVWGSHWGQATDVVTAKDESAN